MIARYNESRERLLTPQQELDRFWKPAAELRTEHGAQRLREAMNECGRVQATSINYAATICGRLASDAAKASTNPDAQPGAFDYLGDDAA
jgi:phytoene/squalene synthetase